MEPSTSSKATNEVALTFTHTLNGVVTMAVVLQCVYVFTCFADGGSLLTDPRLIANMQSATYTAFAVLVVIGIEMLCFRQPAGKTFWERYKDTPAMYLAIAIVFAHMLGFGAYGLVSLVLARNTLDPADGTDQLPKAMKEAIDVAYWPHVIGMGLCMLATVLQFVPQVRQWDNYSFHKLNGWLIVVAGTIGVLASFVINSLELFLPMRYGSRNTSPHFWMESLDFFVAGVGALTSSTLGAYYAVKRDIPRHAAWMHRLVAWWMSASAARIYFIPLFVPISTYLGLQYANWVEAWISLVVPLVIVELWIQFSGRFEALESGEEGNKPKDVDSEDVKLKTPGVKNYGATT